jgi:hypothetical protein
MLILLGLFVWWLDRSNHIEHGHIMNIFNAGRNASAIFFADDGKYREIHAVKALSFAWICLFLSIMFL